MLFLTFLSITNWPTALLRVAGCPCACGDSLFPLSTSTKAQSSGQNGHDHDRLNKFQSISPPFVASCTARVRSHGQQRFCQVLWMYGRRCCLDWKFQCQTSKTCPVMLSEVLQRNAEHEARLSNISDLCRSWFHENKPRSFARAQDDKSLTMDLGCLELFGVTPQSRPACPRPPVRTVRSRPRYASARTRDSRPRRFCLRAWYRECR